MNNGIVYLSFVRTELWQDQEQCRLNKLNIKIETEILLLNKYFYSIRGIADITESIVVIL